MRGVPCVEYVAYEWVVYATVFCGGGVCVFVMCVCVFNLQKQNFTHCSDACGHPKEHFSCLLFGEKKRTKTNNNRQFRTTFLNQLMPPPSGTVCGVTLTGPVASAVTPQSIKCPSWVVGG